MPTNPEQGRLFDSESVPPRSMFWLKSEKKLIGGGFIDETEGLQEWFDKRWKEPLDNSHIARTIDYLKGYELKMAKDLSPDSLYSHNAIEHVIWAFGQPDKDMFTRAHYRFGRFFDAVVNYYAIYANFFRNTDELYQFSRFPHYLWRYPFERSGKKIAEPNQLKSEEEIALVHGRYEGGFPHPEHIDAIERLVMLKKENLNLRVMVGVDSGYTIRKGMDVLVTPLFACSTIAQLPGVDYVCEMVGPRGEDWRQPWMDPKKFQQAPVSYQSNREEWKAFYKEFYQKFRVHYLFIRTDAGNPFKDDQLERAQKLGITPVTVSREGLSISDSILRDRHRGYKKSPYTGETYLSDFDEEAEEMALKIVFKLIPELEEKKRQKRETSNMT